jgi:hypothetical protein
VDDPVAILEVGASTNWNFNGGAATFAPNLAAECTPIGNWLELEAGVSPFTLGARRNGTRIFSSRSHGPFPKRSSSCSVSGRNGLTCASIALLMVVAGVYCVLSFAVKPP